VAMTSPVLAIENLVVRYPEAERPTLDGLTLSLSPGERLALVGPSGCGKSTVARAVLQLLPPGSQCSGSLLLAGQNPSQMARPALRQLRGEAVGLVFQDPMTRLNPLLTIGAHLADTLAAHRPRWQRRQVRQRAETLLIRVGIGPERYGSYPHEFSGGMRQRLAIALAMALEPPLVIADEPTTSLDVAVAGQVMAELSNLCRSATTWPWRAAGATRSSCWIRDAWWNRRQPGSCCWPPPPPWPNGWWPRHGSGRALKVCRHRQHRCCWKSSSCAAGIPCHPCPGKPAGSRR
jgi:ABC-type glutathione transport system ATPase component